MAAFVHERGGYIASRLGFEKSNFQVRQVWCKSAKCGGPKRSHSHNRGDGRNSAGWPANYPARHDPRQPRRFRMSSPSPVLPTSPVHLPPRRHALGLPAGSIRALLAFGVLALLWALLLNYVRQKGEGADLPKLPVDFIYLQYLMILILAHFFTAHGHTIGPKVSTGSPLGLPRGSIRFLLLLGVLGLAYYL